ncbi:MAG: hypothetical protein ACKVE4_02885 [Dissulfuribacterales bacterium]
MANNSNKLSFYIIDLIGDTGMTIKKGYNKSLIEELDSVDWPAIMPALIKYAREKEQKLIRVGSDMVYIEIVKEAIARVYGQGKSGKYRNWDSAKYPDLSIFLKFVINDVVRREVSRLTGFNLEQLCWDDDSGEERAFSISPYDDADAHQYRTQEDSMTDMEGADRLSVILDEISDKDEDLGMIILCIKDGIVKREKIAETTGFDLVSVTNLRRKLKRRLSWYKEKYMMNN